MQGLGNSVARWLRFAQHARSHRAPDGEQYSQKDKEPDAKGFHFFRLPQAVRGQCRTRPGLLAGNQAVRRDSTPR